MSVCERFECIQRTECIYSCSQRGNSPSLRAGAFSRMCAIIPQRNESKLFVALVAQRRTTDYRITPASLEEKHRSFGRVWLFLSIHFFIRTGFCIRIELYCPRFFFIVEMTETNICMFCHNFQNRSNDKFIRAMGILRVTVDLKSIFAIPFNYPAIAESSWYVYNSTIYLFVYFFQLILELAELVYYIRMCLRSTNANCVETAKDFEFK